MWSIHAKFSIDRWSSDAVGYLLTFWIKLGTVSLELDRSWWLIPFIKVEPTCFKNVSTSHPHFFFKKRDMFNPSGFCQVHFRDMFNPPGLGQDMQLHRKTRPCQSVCRSDLSSQLRWKILGTASGLGGILGKRVTQLENVGRYGFQWFQSISVSVMMVPFKVEHLPVGDLGSQGQRKTYPLEIAEEGRLLNLEMPGRWASDPSCPWQGTSIDVQVDQFVPPAPWKTCGESTNLLNLWGKGTRWSKQESAYL